MKKFTDGINEERSLLKMVERFLGLTKQEDGGTNAGESEEDEDAYDNSSADEEAYSNLNTELQA